MQRRAAQRPYVRLRPLAYVTGSWPRGCIGSPPERGAEAYTVWSGHVSALDPRLALIKVWVLYVPEFQDPVVSGLDPTQRGPGLIPGVWFVSLGVLDLTRRSSPYIQGSGTFLWGFGPTVDALEHIVFSGRVVGSDAVVDALEHIVFSGRVAAPEPPAWWGRTLFATRLEIVAWTPHLHTVVRGTPVSGYRQGPPGPPQGRIRACRWGQSLIGDWRAASVRLLT
jgi:hypothetical protein